MIAKQDWIDLPVGYNLMDHTNTDLIVNHPNVSFYNFDAAWNRPIASDKDSYLGHRTGILAQSAPNIGPMVLLLYPPQRTRAVMNQELT